MARDVGGGKRSNGLWGLLSFLSSAVVLIGAVALVGAFIFLAEVNRPGPAPESAVFIAESGASAASIGDALVDRGLVRNALAFRLATRAYAQGRPLRAGEYEIAASASVKDIVAQLAEGRSIQHAVTIPEGYTMAMAMKVVAESDILSGEMPEALPAEGAILPETYHVQRGMDRAALVAQMQADHDAAVAEIWEKRAPNLPISTPEEMVILASIVQREAGNSEELPRVAAVFVNRLRQGIQLQSDPTIIYGVCLRLPQRCRDGRLINERTGAIRTIRESEIAMDTGYNTYRISRLPPTPIANPGRAAMEATVNPAATEDLFFVADGTGGHAFARTVDEHNANVARWREIERVRLAEEAAAAQP